MKDYCGWRARIGLIYIDSSTVMEPEFYAMAPEGVSIHTTRIHLKDATVTGLRELMGSDEIEAATTLLSRAPLHVVTFGGTSATFLEGIGYDKKVVARMESLLDGVPASTTSTAALRAMEAIGAKKVSFVGPYLDEVISRGRQFFEQNGYAVTGAHGMGYRGDPEMSAIPLERTYEFTKSVVEPAADAVFISCTALRTVGAIEALEADLGVPVVSAIQCTFWDALRLASVGDNCPGFGSLFAH